MPFVRKPLSDSDLERGRAQASKIRMLAGAGATMIEVARAYRLPVGVVERVLSESPSERPPSGAGSGAGPSGLGIRPEEVPGPVVANPLLSGPYSISTVGDSLFQLAREIGLSEQLSRGICRRFSNLPPDDFHGLNRILTEAGVSRAARDYITNGLREQLGLTASAPKAEAPARAVPEEESAASRLRRTLQETLELKQLQAMLQNIDRPTENNNTELEKLKAENSALREALRNHELGELLARQLAPLHERLKKLEDQTAPTALSRDDVIVKSLDRSLAVLASKASESGKLREGLIEAGAPKVLLRAAQKALSTDEERSEVFLPPTPAQLEALRARMEDEEAPTEGPGLIVPGNGRSARVGPEEPGA